MRLQERRGLTRAVRAVLCVLAAVVSMVAVRTAAIAASPTKDARAPRTAPRLIVKLKPALAARIEGKLPAADVAASEAQADPTVSEFLARHAARRMSPLYPALVSMKRDAGLTDREIANAVRQRFQARARRFRGTAPAPTLSRTYVVEVDGAVDQALAALRADPDVEYAEEDKVVSVGFTPNDPYFGSTGTWGQAYDDLWGLKKIGVPSAWDLSTAGQGVTVAVIDTGVDFGHPDLSQQIWTNGGEVAGNGIDDDGNGYVDDVHGWDFVGPFYGSPVQDNDPSDGHGHGSHVAGTIAAQGNNGVGVVGVAFGARIMAVKGLDNNGNGLDSSLATAITYAANNGADVINASWGGPGTSQAIADAITYAHSLGVVVVVAAGNDGADARNYYPAGLADVITVSATAPDDTLASFSNWGSRVDVAAPGMDILSVRASGTTMGTPVGPGFTRASGTSMAAPHVSGLAALILTLHPSFTNEEIRQVLRASATDLGGPGVDGSFGYGRVNARAAVELNGVLEAKIFTPRDGTRLGGSTTFTGVARGTGFIHYVLAYGAGPSPAQWTTVQDSFTPASGGVLGTIDGMAIPDGVYTVRLTAYDATARAFVDQIQVDVDNLSITSPPPATVPSTASVFRPGVTIPVAGTATAPGLQSFRLEWAAGIYPTTGWSSQGVVLTGGGTSPVTNGSLGTWATPSVSQADYYTLRLVVVGASSTSETRTLVYLEPDLLNAAWPKWLDQGPNARSGAIPAIDELGNVRLQVVNPPYLTTPMPSRLWTFLPSGAPPTTQDLFYGSYSNPAAGNVDGIPGDETVVAEAWSIRVFRKDGTSYSLLPGALTVNFQQAVVLIEDLDGDGTNEVIAVGSDWNSHKAYVFAWKADGQQVSPAFPLQVEDQNDYLLTWNREPRVFVADIDGAGGKELLVTEGVSPGSYRVRVFGADGSPRVSMPVLNGYGLLQVTLADFEGDGRLEIVGIATDGSQASVHVFEPDGTERPGWPQWLLYPSLATNMAIADLDRDGRSEVIVLNYSTLYVFKADGTTFSPAWPRYDPMNNGLGGLTVADVDGDGYPDILVTQQFTMPMPGGMAVPAATLPEADGVTVQQVSPDAEVRSRVQEDGSVATGTFVTPAASGSAASYYEPKLLVIRRDGMITRSWRLLGAQGDQPYYQSTLTVGDFDRDGTTDIAVSYQTIDGGGQSGWLNEGILTILKTGAGRTVSADWPMVYHDARNTSRLGAAASAGPPAIVITSPVNGATISGAVALSVTATNDQPILGVQYLLDGLPLGPEVSAAPYGATFDTAPFFLAPHSLMAVMRDALGRFTPSLPVNVTIVDTQPPAATILFPFPGITQTGQVGVTIGATDERGLVTLVELYVDGVKRASVPGGSASTYALQWNTTLDGDGLHNLQAKAYDPSGNVGLSDVVPVNTQNGRASYDPSRKVPFCPLIGTTCDSGALLNGRAGLGPEVNQPNTLNASCADGTAGTYHVDPSIDAIKVVSVDGRPLRWGSTARIDVTVWAKTPSAERLDLFYTANVSTPSWTFLRTLTPAGSGSRVLTTTYTLPTSGIQGLRAQYRNLGTLTPCTGGTLNDHDDIVFAVKTNYVPTAKANGPYQGQNGDVITFSSAGSADPDFDPLTYQWTFGDGGSSTLANPTHVYGSGGNYTAQLVVRDGVYASTVSSAPVTITWRPTLELFIQGHNGGSGTVTMAPSGEICANAPGGSQYCKYTYPETTTLTLTATPAADSTFAGWAGDCSGTGPCQISVNSLFSVQATFDGPPPATGILDVAVSGTQGGQGSVLITPPGTTCANMPGATQLCSTSPALNSVVSLAAMPGPDSIFTGWSGACTGTGMCNVTVAEYQQVTANFRGPQILDVFVTGVQGGSGVVRATPPGTTCANAPGSDPFNPGQLCSTTHRVGTVVLLDPTPSPDSVFVGWTGACTGTGACTVTMDDYRQVTATFRGPQVLDVFVTGVQGGSGVVRATPPGTTCANAPGSDPFNSGQLCSTTHRVGTVVLLDPTPSPDSVFVGWTGACTGTGACTVTMDDYRQVTATFRGPQVLEVFVTGVEGGGGTVQISPPSTTCANPPGEGHLCSTTHRVGTVVLLDATPAPNSVFVGWTGACAGVGPCTVTMDDYRQATATFRGPQTLAVSLTATLGGSGVVQVDPPGQTCALAGEASVQCAYLERVGTVVTLTALPASDTLFLGWGGACSGSGACTVSVAEATAVTAAFRLANRAPVAMAGGPYTAPRGVAVEFDGRGSSDPDGDTLTHRWDFGDGTSGTGPTPTHAYAALGSYVATLIVNDGALDSTAATATVTIVNRPPVADIGGPYAARHGAPVSFDASHTTDADGDPLTFAWTFGDGSTASAANPSHVYAADRDYPVTLEVSDGTDTVTAATTVHITNDVPLADAGGPYSGFKNVAFTLDGTASSDGNGDPLTYRWDFGDGTTGTGVRPSHTYAIPAGNPSHVYTASLVVNDGLSDSAPATATVQVLDHAPHADPGPVAITGYRNQPVGFDASASSDEDGDALTYRWEFGDGATSTDRNPTHPYAAFGGYTARLVVNDGHLDSAPAFVAITIVDRAPAASAGGPYAAFRGAAITFDGSGSSDPDGNALTYSWDFGDGSAPGTGVSPAHAYASLGTFTVRLVVSDGATASVPAFATVTIDNRGPVASPGGPYSGVRGAAVTLSGAGSSDPDGDPVTYRWTFGDGGTSTAGAPAHAYATLGTFTVTLIVNDGQVDSAPATTTVTIANRAPTAGPGGPYAGLRGLSVAFNGGTSSDPDGDALTYAWAFGDGATGTGPAPTHAYGTLGTFTVSLVVNDGFTSSTPATTTVTVSNRPPMANAGSDRTVVRRTSVTLDGRASSDPDGTITAYSWRQLSGPTVSVTNASTAQPRFTAPNVQSTTNLSFELKVTDNNGATATDTIVVTVTR